MWGVYLSLRGAKRRGNLLRMRLPRRFAPRNDKQRCATGTTRAVYYNYYSLVTFTGGNLTDLFLKKYQKITR